MAYQRPIDLQNAAWHLIASPMLTAAGSSTTFDIIFPSNDVRRSIAIAYYVGTVGDGWDGQPHYGMGPGIRLGGASNPWQYPHTDLTGGAPGETKWGIYNWTVDPAETSSSGSNWYLAGFNDTNGLGQAIFPQGAQWQFFAGTMEVFSFNSGGGGGPVDPGNPLGTIGPCPPVARPPYPYLDPYVAIGNGPPGVVRRRR